MGSYQVDINASGVISSIIAVVVAILIPKSIADRQDKIALYEKRYEGYTELNKLIQILTYLENSVESERVSKYIVLNVIAGLYKPDLIVTSELCSLDLRIELSININISKNKMMIASFIISDDFKYDVHYFVDQLLRLLDGATTGKSIVEGYVDKQIIDNFISVIRKSYRYIDIVESQLKL